MASLFRRGQRCSLTRPECPDGLRCDFAQKRCRSQSATDAYGRQVGVQQLRGMRRGRIRRTPWDPARQPGTPGFNSYATKVMVQSGLTDEKTFVIRCPTADQPSVKLNAFQKTPVFLVHPKTPVHRFLVADRAGSGKTLIILFILQNFWRDPRPKILIFPNEEVLLNFFQELLRFPNKYRSYCTGRLGKLNPNNRNDVRKAIDLLQMKGELSKRGQRGYLYSPLLALRYTIAGGATVLGKSEGTLPIFRLRDRGRRDAGQTQSRYSDKIVMMDEYHNLLKPKAEVLQYRRKLENLRQALYDATDSVIVGFTATPIVDDVKDAQRIVQEIKGREYEDAENDEGFVSFFQSLPTSIYPSVEPGNPSRVFPYIREVAMQGYNAQYYKEAEQRLKVPGAKRDRLLQNYCNLASYYGFRPKFRRLLRRSPFSYATKLAAVAEEVAQDTRKTLILIHRNVGFRALVELLKRKRVSFASLYAPPKRTDKGKAKNVLTRYNSAANDEGQETRVLVADAKFYSEGVSFFPVRHLILVSPPATYADYEQRVGRVLRACKYQQFLPDKDRSVEISMFVATLPNPSRSTVDMRQVDRLKSEQAEFVGALDELRRVAVDRLVLEPLLEKQSRRFRSVVRRPVRLPVDSRLEYKRSAVRGMKRKPRNSDTVKQLKARCKKLGIKVQTTWRKPRLLKECGKYRPD